MAAGADGSQTAAGDEAPDEPPPPPPALEPRIGATISGTLQPGETVVHTVHLEADEYVEVYFSHISSEARFRLYTPADLADQPSVAIGWGEYHADPKGQSLWGLSRGEGEYQLEVRAKPDTEACPYSLEILEFHTIGEKELAKQAGEEAWEAWEKASSDGHPEEALAYLGEALERWTEADYIRGVAASYGRRGSILRTLGNLDEAAHALRKAVENWTIAQDPQGVSINLSELSQVEGAQGNWEVAFEIVNQAIGIAHNSNLPVYEGRALEALCSLYLARGEAQQAIEACERTVAHWSDSGLPLEAADALNNLGLIHRRTGELEKAHAYYLQVLEILEERPDPSRSASVHRNLGVLHDSLGNFQQALTEYQQALRTYKDLAQDGQVADTLYAIGTLYERTGNLDDTLLYYERALEIQERTGPAKNLALTLFGIGWVHLQAKELDQARRYLERALSISRATRSKYLIAWTLEGIADLRLAEAHPEEAVQIVEEALRLQEDVRNRWDQSRLLYQLSRAQLQLGKPGQALEALRRAAAINSEIGNRRGLAGNHYHMAQIYRSRGDLSAARHSIEQALAIADALRERVTSRDLRTLVGSTHQDYHELFIDILMNQDERSPSAGHAAEALRAAEQARAQSLLEVLVEADLELGKSASPELVREREEIRQRLVQVEGRRARLLRETEGTVEASELFGVKLELDRLLAALGETERMIRNASPSYAALTRPEPATVGEIQRSLLDEETVLLEFRLGHERSFLFAVTPDGLLTFTLPGRKALEEDARCIHWLISEFGSPGALESNHSSECVGDPSDPSLNPSGSTIFEVRAQLRRKVEEALKRRMETLSERIFGQAAQAGALDYSRLVLVADGALEYVPFAALPAPSDGRALILDHEIARLPSASFLDFHRRHAHEDRSTDNTLAIIADPLYEPEDQRISNSVNRPMNRAGDSSEDEQRFRRLPFASEEAEAIAAFAPPEKTLLALGENATRDRVLGASLSDYRYLHFATHGEIDTHYPQLSGLVLSLVNEHGEPTEDGFLRLHDIYEMQLNADMVVLSACETALGREIRGEGLVGLARGFMYAGAERVVASLWQVQDRATAELMEHFYRGLLKEGRSPADALRHAQLEMISEPGGRYSFPYYWAGFVLQGEWR